MYFDKFTRQTTDRQFRQPQGHITRAQAVRVVITLLQVIYIIYRNKPPQEPLELLQRGFLFDLEVLCKTFAKTLVRLQ